MNSLCVKFQCGCRDDDGHRHPRYPRRLGSFLFSPVAQDVIRSRALTLTLVTKFDVVGYRVIFGNSRSGKQLSALVFGLSH